MEATHASGPGRRPRVDAAGAPRSIDGRDPDDLLRADRVRRRALGLLVLYHQRDYAWTATSATWPRLRRPHGDAIGNAGWPIRPAPGRPAARHLRAGRPAQPAPGRHGIAKPSSRGRASSTTTRSGSTGRPRDRDVRADRLPGQFLGRNPDPSLRVRSAWPDRLGRRTAVGPARRRLGDPRTIVVVTDGPESMLLVPMTYEGPSTASSSCPRRAATGSMPTTRRPCRSSPATRPRPWSTPTNLERLRRQQAELEHQLEGQRRLLEVNERLLSTLDPAGVLDLIADSLKAIVPYDSLTIYRVDRAAGVRRAVIARDRFAELDPRPREPARRRASPAGSSTTARRSWPTRPTSTRAPSRCPGTPFEPESMIVVPLLVDGEAIGTLNIGRMGEAEAAFSPNEFELTKLFAGPGVDRPPERRDPRRGPGPGRPGRADRAAQPRRVPARAERAGSRPATAAAVRGADARPRRVQGASTTRCGHPAGDALLVDDRPGAWPARPATATGCTATAATSSRRSCPAPTGWSRHDVAEPDPARRRRRARRPPAARCVTVSAGVACYPGRRPDQGRAGRGRGPRAVPGQAGGRRQRDRDRRDDPYLRALDETALALLDRHDPTVLLETILTRATALLGTPHGYIYLVEPDERTLMRPPRHAACSPEFVGHRMPIDEGLGGQVYRTGAPLAVDDYDAFDRRAGGRARPRRSGPSSACR